MNVLEVLAALRGLNAEELRNVNTAAVSLIRANRQLDSVKMAMAVRVGDIYMLDGIRPKYLNGQKVRITEVRRTKVVVENATTQDRIGIVPVSCLKPFA